MKKTLIILCLFVWHILPAQNNLDSLLKVAGGTSGDPHAQALANSALAKNFLYRNADSALLFAQRALQLSKKAGDARIMGEAYRRLGAIHQLYATIDSARYFTDLALHWSTKAHDTIGISSAYLNLGNIMDRLGKFPEAIEMNKKSAAWAALMKDNLGVAYALGNIGNAYQKMEFYDKAVEFHLASLAKAEAENDLQLIANSHNNLGISYSNTGNYSRSNEEYKKAGDMYRELGQGILSAQVITNRAANHERMGQAQEALKLYRESLAMNEDLMDSYGSGIVLNGLGHVYINLGKHDSALWVLHRSIKEFASSGSRDGIVSSRALIPDVYFDLKEYDECLRMNLANLPDAIKENLTGTLRDTYAQLAVIYKAKGNYTRALEYMEKNIIYRDSLDNDVSRRSILRSEMQFEYGKKAAADSVKAGEEKKIAQAQFKSEKTQRRVLYGGLGLVGLFALFMVNRFVVTNKQRKIIEIQRQEVLLQKAVVEEKQKEIMDSIYYARRIQRSLIPSESYIAKHLKRLRAAG